jgi:hypothetical protein
MDIAADAISADTGYPVDTGRFVGTFVRLYPRLRQPYADLDHPTRDFKDRMIEVTDQLPAAPVRN